MPWWELGGISWDAGERRLVERNLDTIRKSVGPVEDAPSSKTSGRPPGEVSGLYSFIEAKLSSVCGRDGGQNHCESSAQAFSR